MTGTRSKSKSTEGNSAKRGNNDDTRAVEEMNDSKKFKTVTFNVRYNFFCNL